MQLVTRLLLRLCAVGILMMVVTLSVALYAAQKDIGRETVASQQVGQLIRIQTALQSGLPLSAQVQAINALNDSEALRHLHVALFDQDGRRLTQPDSNAEPIPLLWLHKILTREVALAAYAQPVLRPDGERLTIVLEPNPYSESAEALYNALLFLGLYAALAGALIAAMWISVKLAFAPLTDILATLARFEAGDFATRLAHSATRELNLIVQAMNHLAATLAEQIAKQRDLLHRLQDVQEEERRKLAHELHDEFGQLLTAMQVDASYLRKKTVGQPELEACASAMYDNSSSILSQLKNLLAQLRPYGLQGGEERDIALEQALRDLVRQRQSRSDAELSCTLSVELAGVNVPQRLAVAVYRISQEALTNVMRHAQASHVDIAVSVDAVGHTLKLAVTDNGVGLGNELAPAGLSGPPGLGLAGIRERILANQGILHMRRNAPQGVCLEAVFPLPISEAAHVA
jgi:two-component system sensor histidine kinase UhpB